ncbi:hypothetical protein [Deinococcus sp. Marseille-Q6407]|uniref:hypothetical protein n=1 Tax=Deinococcus sp. Marseille-Q6407 TaxID=2969223 RepID=UPI0021BE7DAD|nr:hypothetical protein [Deinococcus sp. Marseille-Q6407]
MPVSRAPQRSLPPGRDDELPDEQSVLEIIQRGGSVKADSKPVTDPEVPTDPLKKVQLRLYQSMLDEIDVLRRQQAKGRRPVSRHAWIVAAIEEKLKK